MGFKLNNFYNQTNKKSSPLKQNSRDFNELLEAKQKDLDALLLKPTFQENKFKFPTSEQLQNRLDFNENDNLNEFGKAWNNNFKIINGRKVDQYGNSYPNTALGFLEFKKAADDWNAGQENKQSLNSEAIESSQAGPTDSTVTSTITGEPVNVMDRSQMRAARRADRLERKEIRKGALTPGQARRLQKNKDVISRETRDRTKMGDVVQSVGNLFKKSPMNANKPVGAVELDEVVVKASDKKSRVKHRLSKTRKKKNEATGAKKERLEKREQRLMKRRDKNTEKASKDTSKGKKIYSKKEGKEKRGK